MKSLLLATTLLALGVGTAAAQDQAYDWSGAYVGVQGGYGWGARTIHVDTYDSPINTDGFMGGVRAGYDWQSGPVVFGAVADVEYSDRSGANIGALANSAGSNQKWLGSLRARIGFEVLPKTLLYGTAGLAFADVKYSYSNVRKASSASHFETGWTAGIGAEYAVNTNWTTSLEYRHTDLGKRVAVGPAPFLSNTFTHQLSSNDLRLGIAYKF